jgi:hypothetical protein
MNKYKPIPDSDFYHEMADRLHVITCTIDVHLLQHPVAKLDKKISKNIEKALELLEEAYLEAGSKM